MGGAEYRAAGRKVDGAEPMSAKHFTLTRVQAGTGYTLALKFADGQSFQVDLTDVIGRHPTLAALKEPAIFATAAVGDWGGSVIWSQDDELELAVDNLRALAIEQAGGYSHQRVIEWMALHNLTLNAGARALGLSRRMLAYYRSGEKPVPRTVALAMLGWEVEQEDRYDAAA